MKSDKEQIETSYNRFRFLPYCIDNLLDRISTSTSIKRKLLIYIYSANIWTTLREIQARGRDDKVAANQLQIKIAHQDHRAELDYLAGLDGRWQSAATSSAPDSSLNPIDSKEHTDLGRNLRYGLLPVMPRAARFYYTASTSLHVFMVIYNYLFYRMILDKEAKYYFFSCLMPRFLINEYFHQNLTIQMGWILSLLHVAWRSLMFAFSRKMPLDTVEFLLIDEDILEQIRSASDGRPVSSPEIIQLMKSKRYATIRDNLFYRCETTHRYILRLNRTARARQNMIRLTETTGLIIIIPTVVVGSVFVIYATYTILVHQEKFYEGCPIIKYDFAYCFRIFGSLLLGFMYLADTAMALCFTLIGTFYTIYDLRLYWESIEKKIHYLRVALPKWRAIQEESADQYAPVLAFKKETPEAYFTCKVTMRHSKVIFDCIHSAGPESHRRLVQQNAQVIRRKLVQVQRCLADFYKQLHRANIYISCLVSFNLIIWLVFNTSITLTGVQTDTSLSFIDQTTIRLIQSVGFFFTALVSWFLLKLKSSTEPAYVKLSSIVAYDPRINKTNWLKLLRYYTDKPEYAFTYLSPLLKRNLYSRLSFLKTLSYTITFVFLVQSLQQTRQRTKPNQANAQIP